MKTFTMLLTVCLFSVFSATAQNVTVSGTVKDSGGSYLAGVNINVKGAASHGTTTDANGKYSMAVKSTETLQFSYLGYETKEVYVGTRKVIDVVMVDDAQMMDDVVVIGYGNVKRSDLTGAVASVSTESLTKSSSGSVYNALQGQVAGVNISVTNGKPGSSFSMNIRGLNSFGTASPLVVIDGVPGADMSTVNPEDIDKLDVLKDASATAIYGSRGANGVIIITTKRGKAGRPTINYSGYVGFQDPVNEPEFMSPDDWVQLAREYVRAKNNNVYKTDEQVFTDPSELKAVQDKNYYDWYDAIRNKMPIKTSHTVSAMGGNENATYSLAAGYYNERGLVDPESYIRYNLRASVDVKANDYIQFGGSLYGTYYTNDRGNHDILQDCFRARPTQHPNSLVTGEELWKFSSNGIFNPMITQKNVTVQSKSTNILGNVYLNITPMEGLSLKTTFAPNIRNNNGGRFRDTWSKALQGTSKPTAYNQNDIYTDYVWDNVINYKTRIREHSIDFTGVFSMQQNMYEYLYGEVKDLQYNSLWYNLQGGTVTSLKSSYTKSNLMSYSGRINYSFKDKYLLTVSGRYDGSSKLAEGHNWHFFPSAALAWRIGEEKFVKQIDWISNLKLRLSYGQSGNDNVNPYQTQGTIAGTNYVFGSSSATGYVPGTFATKQLTWEKTAEYNAGLDFGFLNNRISGSFDYYNRLTTDLIMSRTLPIHTGFSSVKDNVGSVRNSGIEIALNTVNVKTKDFEWHTNITLSYNKNQIVDLAYKEDLGAYSDQLKGMQGDYTNKWFIGQPIKVNWTYQYIGVWQTDEADEAALYGAKPGQYKIKDFNDNKSIKAGEDQYICGKQTPDWIGGITNKFYYKNLDLSVHAYFTTGITARSQLFVGYTGENTQYNFKNLKMDYWTPENPTNDYAQPGNQGSYRNNMSKMYRNADFLKIAYINLGYTFDKKMLEKAQIGALRVYATVQNPFVFTSFLGLDPENPLQTNLGDESIMRATYMLGVNITF